MKRYNISLEQSIDDDTGDVITSAVLTPVQSGKYVLVSDCKKAIAEALINYSYIVSKAYEESDKQEIEIYCDQIAKRVMEDDI